ncbi:hypothetical protein ACA910_009267 [Epithemia clementina (nom. ined.)]
MPNVVVLGARRDRQKDFRDFNGLEVDDLDDAIIAGSRGLLLSYHAAAEDRLLLETRLDADDALQKYFVESVQHQAAIMLVSCLRTLLVDKMGSAKKG